MSKHLSSLEDYAKLLEEYDTWLFDCDGVLWQGDLIIDGAIEVLDLLRSKSTYCTSVCKHAFTRIHIRRIIKI